MRPLFVGEDNPYGSNPRYALYPYPANSAGGRLCFKILELEMREYLKRYDRVNLCTGKWSIKAARLKVGELKKALGPGQTYVLLGSKVCSAFDVPFEPFSIQWADGVQRDGATIVLPHPSGLNRLGNEPGMFEKAREALYRAEVLPRKGL